MGLRPVRTFRVDLACPARRPGKKSITLACSACYSQSQLSAVTSPETANHVGPIDISFEVSAEQNKLAMRPPKRQRKGVILDSDDETDKASQTSTTSAVSAQAPVRRATKRATRASPSTTQKKGKGGSLHSFFNARTRAQMVDSRTSESAISPTENVEQDLDDVEEDDIEEARLTGGPAKRKFTPVPSRKVEDATPKAQRSTTRVKEPQQGSAARDVANRSITTTNVASKPWVDLFPPLDLDELAVHKKKVSEVAEWMRSATSGNAYRRLLVLKGPAGSGKTATVSALAKSTGLRLVEWSNPNGSTYGQDDYSSASAQFDDFVGGSGPFSSLSFDDTPPPPEEDGVPSGVRNRDRVTLIEEIHVIARWSTALLRFRETIMVHLSSLASQPMVIVLSEEDNTFSSTVDVMTAHQLLGPEILQHPATAIIEFNSVAPTFVSKAIDLVIKKEARLSGRRRIPGPSLLRALAETADIRSAIGMLEMMCLNEHDAALSGRVAGKGSKTARTKAQLTEKEQATLNAISQRESHLGLFHAVGKVVYNKREQTSAEQPPDHLVEMVRPLRSIVAPDELFAQAATDVGTFVAALHENYALSCEAEDPLEHLDACLANLSDADLMIGLGSMKGFVRATHQGSTVVDSLRHDEMVFNTAVRGLLFSLPYPVKRKTKSATGRSDPYKMQYPTSIRLRRQIMDGRESLTQYALQSIFSTSSTISTNRTSNHKNGVEAWSSSRTPLGLPDRAEEETIESGPSKASSSLSKAELVTVQLPFLSRINQRELSAGKLHDLVHFESPTAPETSHGTGRGHRNVLANKIARRGPADEDSHISQKLVLSDDDIEDIEDD